MSEGAPISVPPPGAEELSAAGVPDGGLVTDAPTPELTPVHRSATRGKRFGALAKNVWVLGSTWILAIAALIVVGSNAGIAVGAAAAGAVLLVALIIVLPSPRVRQRTISIRHTPTAAASCARARRATFHP